MKRSKRTDRIRRLWEIAMRWLTNHGEVYVYKPDDDQQVLAWHLIRLQSRVRELEILCRVLEERKPTTSPSTEPSVN